MPVTLTHLARMIDTNRSFAGLAFMAVVALMTGAILFQTENVVFPAQGSLVPANPNDIVRAIAGKGELGVGGGGGASMHINPTHSVICPFIHTPHLVICPFTATLYQNVYAPRLHLFFFFFLLVEREWRMTRVCV